MSKEPTLIRRYTPPTCTLEIAAQQSPLSRWMGKIALKDLRFKLSFDDPRVNDDRWITLRGDRDQLESLSTAVNDYVQSFLTQSSAGINSGGTLLAAPATVTESGIAIQPKGLLSHQLQLGSLATAESGAALPLSSTQLADLATALDEYAAEATSMPKLERPVWLRQPQNWAAMAAGLLVAVGLSTSVLKGLDKSSPTTANAPTASSSDQRLAVQPPTSPSPGFPSLGNSPLAALPPGQLPPPGTLTLPSPMASTPGQPNIPGSPSPSPSATADANTPTIGNNQSGNNQSGNNQSGNNAKPEIVSIPNPATPNIQDKASTTNEKPTATKVDPIAGGVDAETLRKQRALEESADALKDAPEPAPPAAPSVAAARAPIAAPRDNRSEQASALQQVVQAGWKKPDAPAAGSIEYRVVINADGTLGAVEPLTADQQQQALGNQAIPAQGSKVAPKSEDGRPSTVRLNLGVDGIVNAIPE
jgi:Domain of unknown function (DUF4335)